jgi:hypothetical protein
MAEYAIRDEQPWVTVAIGDGWQSSFRLAIEAGEVVVAELRIAPEGAVPPGGLTARRARDACRFGPALKFSREALAAEYREHGEGHQLFRPTQVDSESWRAWASGQLERRPGPRSRGDLVYAVLAASYADKIQAGRRDAARLIAEELGRTPSHVRELVATARERGLLTETKQGRAGGALTQKAIDLLRQHIDPPGIPSAEAFGTATVKRGPPPREEES